MTRKYLSKKLEDIKSRARTVSVAFTRNVDFAGQPTLSNDGPEPTIFGGTSGREFVRMSYDFDDTEVVPTEGQVKTAAIVDGDERAVYYVESENGVIADFDKLDDIWVESINFSVMGDMAITPRSDVLVVADDGPSTDPTPAHTMTPAPVEGTPSPTEAPVHGARRISTQFVVLLVASVQGL